MDTLSFISRKGLWFSCFFPLLLFASERTAWEQGAWKDSAFLVLTHYDNEDQVSIAPGSRIKVQLENGDRYQGTLLNLTKEALLVAGQALPLADIKWIFYARRRRTFARVLGTTGSAIAAFLALFAFRVGYTAASDETSTWRSIGVFTRVFSLFMIVPIGLYLLSRRPFRRDRFHLKKKYYAEIQIPQKA